MANNNNSSSDGYRTTRRRFVSGVGATGIAAGLAGCGGQQAAEPADEGNVGTPLPDEAEVQHDGEPQDDTLSLAQWAVPRDSQYNVWNAKNDGEARRMLFDRLMEYNLEEQEYKGYAVSDWAFEGRTLTLTVRDGLTWHDGDAVTGTDVAMQLKFDMYTGGSLGNYVDDVAADVTTPDDRTARIEFSQDINEEVVLAHLQPVRLRAKESIYGEFLDAIESAESEDEEGDAVADLQNYSEPEPIGNGPFAWESADSQRTLLTKFEDHPDVDNVNIPQVEYLYLPENSQRWDALINGKIDGEATLFMPENKVNQLPDSARIGLIPRHWGMGVVFNLEDEQFGDVRVRKAIAHVINRENVAMNSGAGTDSKLAVEIPSGLTGAFNDEIKDQWLDGVVDQFDRYEPDEEKATTLLRDAGYEKDGDSWVDGNGDPLRAPVKGPQGFTDWIAGAETLVSNLKEFGIQSELIAKDTSTYWGKDYDEGDFVLALQGWASYDQSYPYFHFDFIYRSYDAEDVWNVPSEVEVPPMDDPDGSTETVAPADLVSDLSRADGDEADELIRELAWITNQTLPVLPIQEKLAQTFVTDDDWNVPPADSAELQQYWPTEWLPRKGRWTAKRE
ncbi:ABC transporter substrate-binding protein [Halegenticoccus tardaugens]|uniref:ABC transporter substrate-binding protein n=1 Tax=Halegenticoccus tardaugens TaxID=2071624 RepID=UPI00100B9292|nr:ABC transporter substrate-binding protein [Halegenticoccus tardaugens]